MSKIIAAFNMTLDGVFDHTAGLPDQEMHQHYTELLAQGDAILYGRTTYELMEYWQQFLENPSDEKSMNDFALAIDRIPKIVFSRSLAALDWKSARLATRSLKETVLELRQQSGSDIFIGSRSLILQLMKLNLIDEYQVCIQPVVAGSGATFFEDINQRTVLKLVKSKTFASGTIVLYYQPERINS